MTIRNAQEFQDGFGNLGGQQSAQLMNLPLDVLEPWVSPDGNQQPFKPYSREKMQELAENVKKNGIIEPLCVRPSLDGHFQIIAGHNRYQAAQLAGLSTVPVLVRQLDDIQATVLLVDSNLQHRETLLPSEKAFAYRLRLESLKRQGYRSDLTSDPLGPKSGGARSNQEVSAQVGESATQIKRYIRLTELLPTLLEMVDRGKFGFRAAVEVSYLNSAAQEILLCIMDELHAKAPNFNQAQQMKQLYLDGALHDAAIREILSPSKVSKLPQLKFPAERISSFFPRNASVEQMEAEIVEALKAYREAQRPTTGDCEPLGKGID